MGSVLGKITEELPRHQVLKKTAAYEIRKYAPCVVAETSYSSAKGMMEGDQGGSFMRLAKFIGVFRKAENEGQAAIAMTAPVLMSRARGGGGGSGEGDGYKMAFFLPASRFTKSADAPKPTSPDVTIVDIPERTVATITFSGTMRAALIADKEKELREALERDGVKPAAGARAMAAGYNPPWTPSFLKTNEVMLEVARW
mmetsp:Transcript_34734/g.87115  ORF Transcript_34734/g.87115 Transcript_34734/m.87115 type:complete len:199 (-) Transcript_34734:584-1180(-)|eukprot:CAMPEP_0181374104 /NCGR_PEP_ID=MMETSP1106-20121128/15802_1 /TAXON_ID=81844 /ORGANISM="Mantoniella antarctica, Strain SL-175" /LENGTH=198 /DNA_ID=CAMNT_0023491983 /DNA_START=163 /DNA_END=756 /DNA_ORIENTATION=+